MGHEAVDTDTASRRGAHRYFFSISAKKALERRTKSASISAISSPGGSAVSPFCFGEGARSPAATSEDVVDQLHQTAGDAVLGITGDRCGRFGARPFDIATPGALRARG